MEKLRKKMEFNTFDITTAFVRHIHIMIDFVKVHTIKRTEHLIVNNEAVCQITTNGFP